jgi:hypothetical protein
MALAGLVILIIGDSHLAQKDFLLASLQEGLVGQGATVSTYAVCGSQPHDWVAQTTLPCGKAERHNLDEPVIDKSPKVKVWSLADLVRRVRPDLLIVELGDNMGGYGVLPELPRDWITTEVREMLQPVVIAHHLPCLWVGPAWGQEGGPSKKTFARVKELSDYLSGQVAPCRYIDSLKFSQPGQWATFDGEHLTPDSYRIWGTDITAAAIQMLPQMNIHSSGLSR